MSTSDDAIGANDDRINARNRIAKAFFLGRETPAGMTPEEDEALIALARVIQRHEHVPLPWVVQYGDLFKNAFARAQLRRVLWIAARAVPRERLVLGATTVARTVLHKGASGKLMAVRAVEAAEKWLAGEMGEWDVEREASECLIGGAWNHSIGETVARIAGSAAVIVWANVSAVESAMLNIIIGVGDTTVTKRSKRCVKRKRSCAAA